MGVWWGILLLYEATQNSETFERNTQVLSFVYRRAGPISFLILHHCHWAKENVKASVSMTPSSRVPTFFIPWNSLIFPWFPKIFLWFFLSFHQDILIPKKLFFLNVACTYYWGNVYGNTNLLQIHFQRAMYISTTFYLSTHCWKISLIWNFFPLILAEKPWFPWSVGTLSRFGF